MAASLSWNEIKNRAISFSREWKDETSENAGSQSFWNEFFAVFGKKRRALAAFEEPVRNLSGNMSRIDLFWPGTCLVEHKSAGEDLDKAHAQGMKYVRDLIDSGRENEAPRWLIVSDFQRIAIHDLEPERHPDLPLFNRLPQSHTFELKDLHKNIRHFAFIAGYKAQKLNPEDPANFEATELLARLHDSLYDGGYRGHDLCRFLVRLLFCFFADDTGIFPADHLKFYIRDHTAEDGSDLGAKLAHFFRVLDTPESERGKNLDEDLAQFPYINGDLFSENLDFTDFTTGMRRVLLECCDFRWERISPAVFGSLFQTVFDHQDDRKRRQIGAHYTSETNIMKVVRGLFLDEFREEFDAAKRDRSGRGPWRLRDLQERLAKLKFLDPACGCGNFLVVTYRELRQLELEILLQLEHEKIDSQGELLEKSQLDVTGLSKIDVDQMFGIEIEEFSARIAEVALWLADHQANILLSETFGQFFRRIPLRKSPHIRVDNALLIDWKTLLDPEECSYILGNPPFVGSKYMSKEQRAEMKSVWAGIKGSGVLDYVTAWYRIASDYIQHPVPRPSDYIPIKCSFVSTNSISQGEQPFILWNDLFGRFHIKIHFAHRTFAWESEARGKAHVHCIIVGFGAFEPPVKLLYDYDADPDNPTVATVGNISPYLIEGEDFALPNISRPLCDVPRMKIGNKPIDGGHYLFTEKEKSEFIPLEPAAEKWFRKWIGSREFINGWHRWCLWLGDCPPDELRSMPLALARVEEVRKFRLKSKSAPTRKLASTPARFHVENFPNGPFLVIPKVSSERRHYIPIGFLKPPAFCSDLVFIIREATPYHFAILSSNMHMAWLRVVAGRLESRYRYSTGLVYNNFPWPSPTKSQKNQIEAAAQAVLDARKKFPASTLADLYDPVTMPPALAKAHEKLDRTVDRAYRKEPFPSDRDRVEYLFTLYEELAAPLAPKTPKKRRPRKKSP